MHWASLWLPWRFKALSPIDIVQWSVFTPSACLARVRCSKTDYDDIGDVHTCPARAF